MQSQNTEKIAYVKTKIYIHPWVAFMLFIGSFLLVLAVWSSFDKWNVTKLIKDSILTIYVIQLIILFVLLYLWVVVYKTKEIEKFSFYASFKSYTKKLEDWNFFGDFFSLPSDIWEGILWFILFIVVWVIIAFLILYLPFIFFTVFMIFYILFYYTLKFVTKKSKTCKWSLIYSFLNSLLYSSISSLLLFIIIIFLDIFITKL